jgi:hypothetical protein
MIECDKCVNLTRFQDNKYELDELLKWLKTVHNINGKGAYNSNNKRCSLFQCKECGTFWEWRPLYEETIYGGEPGEWIKVSSEYVKEHYPDVRSTK